MGSKGSAQSTQQHWGVESSSATCPPKLKAQPAQAQPPNGQSEGPAKGEQPEDTHQRWVVRFHTILCSWSVSRWITPLQFSTNWLLSVSLTDRTAPVEKAIMVLLRDGSALALRFSMCQSWVSTITHHDGICITTGRQALRSALGKQLTRIAFCLNCVILHQAS